MGTGTSLYGDGTAAEHGKGVGLRDVDTNHQFILNKNFFNNTAKHSAKELESDRKRKAKKEVKAKRQSS